MATGLFMLTAGLAWAAARGSLSTNWAELDIALLIAGVGVSMALPTVPTAVLNAVPQHELGKASGINFMMQRLGPAVAIAVATAVFAAYGNLGTPASVTGGFKPALAACAGFALLAAVSALAISAPKTQPALALTGGGSPGRRFPWASLFSIERRRFPALRVLYGAQGAQWEMSHPALSEAGGADRSGPGGRAGPLGSVPGRFTSRLGEAKCQSSW